MLAQSPKYCLNNCELIIRTEERNDDFIAYLNDDKRKWESGKSREEAIGKLVISRFAEMNISISHKGR